MNKAPLIVSVEPLNGVSLRITWNSGETLLVDLADTIARTPAFTPMNGPDFFKRAVMEEWGHGVNWPGGLDMGADRLYHLCRVQAGLFSPQDFDLWMKENGLSLSTAAESLGMTRRMIAHYRSGSKPIPKTVQLACIGWEALRKAA